MSISAPFIRRPVATTLLTMAIRLVGRLWLIAFAGVAFASSGLSHDSSQANLPGREPGDMASSVATPLERQFGRIAGVTEMTSSAPRLDYDRFAIRS